MSGPLVVQSDKTILLEVDHPDAPAARTAIARLRSAELERSPEHVHTYRITPLALWNARYRRQQRTPSRQSTSWCGSPVTRSLRRSSSTWPTPWAATGAW